MTLTCTASFATEFEDVLASFGNLSTVAGRGQLDNNLSGWTDAMEGGLATAAELSRPHMTMADAAGNLYIADKEANGIRVVTPDGSIATFAGTNVAGYNGDGLATASQVSLPNGLYTFADGTTYILDLGNSRIRRIGTDGTLVTIVEDPDGISAGRGLWVSADETEIFYASGTRVRQWTVEDGLSTYADGFTELGNIDVDPLDGLLVTTDRGGHLVHKVLPDGTKIAIAGNGTTVGGVSGMPATEVALNEVRGINFDTTGGYYVATHRDSDVWYVDTEGIISLLVPGDRNDNTHGGDGQPLTVPGDKISEPRAVAVGPNRELIITENDRGFVRVVPRTSAIGDFDYDGELTPHDIDLLTRVTLAGTDSRLFNLNQAMSRDVDGEDRRIWIEDLAGTKFGDANLDGSVDEIDFAAWEANRFRFDATWATGDFNGDGTTDGVDFNLWAANRTATAGASVPEPSISMLWVLGAAYVLAQMHRSALATCRSDGP